MEITSSLEVMAPRSAGSDPLVVLDGLVSTLQSVESAIAGLQALREYTLAIASRVADVLAEEDTRDGGKNDGGAGPGAFRGLRWDGAELARRAVAAEIATATRANDRTVQRQMGQAVELLDRFPATFQALARGRISLAHARVIQDAGTVLDDPAALARYEAVVVACAEHQAPGRVRRLAVREAEKAQPEPLAARNERAGAQRCVRVTPLPCGMAELAATLPAAVAYGIHDRLTRMARAHAGLARDHAGLARDHATEPGPTTDPACSTDQRSTDQRSTDQLRADFLSELLLCGAPAGHDTADGLLAAITARVDVTVPVLTLIDRDTTGDAGNPAPAPVGTVAGVNTAVQVPAELDGRHPMTGAVLAADRYRPGEDLKRLLTARDTRCRFPGCGIPARDLDLDHTHDAAQGGTTDAGNLAGLCRRHHMLKHHSRWKIRQTGAGNLEWTSPTGRTYKDSPPLPATHISIAPDGLGAAHGGARAPDNAIDPPPF